MLSVEELRQIRRLHIQLNRRVDSPFAGEYRSAFRGQGMEFEDVRPYAPGDDVRHIDWNVTARTGQPFVKQFREERELTLLLLLDLSGSLRVGAGGRDGRTDKRLQLARIAGALSWAAIRNGDRVGIITFTDQIEEVLPPRKVRGHAMRVLRAAFAAPPARRGTDLPGALRRAQQLLRRRAVICVLSDFLTTRPAGPALRLLAARHQVNAFLMHDPLEEGLPRGTGLIELEDAETGARRLIDAAALRPAAPLAERVRQLQRDGAFCTPVSTADDPFHQLLAHFRRLERLR
ncbi:MAG: hypothetical protein RL071_1200 [Pseudomonadota bacterium]|jgi:uncharacterized protein (DUF58 family)